MGSLILCHKKKAKQPYEIFRIHKRIYTIEELCYYLSNNLYLVDYTIMNESLCSWLREELELPELADELNALLTNHGSVEKFVRTILTAANLYTDSELAQIHQILERLKNQKDIERLKYKADNLLESGETEPAVLVYQSILHGERDESVDGTFYGKVYGCLGAAYGRLFLYEEAARMYEAGYQICEDETMLFAYLYCCYRYLPREQYLKLLSKSQIYRNLDKARKEKTELAKEKVYLFPTAELLERWKRNYCKRS